MASLTCNATSLAEYHQRSLVTRFWPKIEIVLFEVKSQEYYRIVNNSSFKNDNASNRYFKKISFLILEAASKFEIAIALLVSEQNNFQK